ncbi:putative baseplate assembly protein [Mesorhizobium sp. M0698]|uniref:putative baseplate assembly protein n=1 Tax=Mesorhizobium sp. M0698 TaxID=2956987 RepID=UPI00333DC218
MSLDSPILDDRRFDDLRTEATERIRLACPEWTDFNPSDPGMTLVELFAWFTDLTLYRMNSLPAKLHGELLSLVGIQPEPAKPALALIEFQPKDNCPTIIPGGTVSPAIDLGGGAVARFQTQRDLHMVRSALDAVTRRLPGEQDVDLTKLNETADRGFDPFGPAGAEKSELRLRFSAKTGDQAGQIFTDIITLHITVMTRLVNDDFSLPEKSTSLPRPQAPPLLWSARMENDVWEPLEIIDDETNHFGRDGFIRIASPRRAVPIAQPAVKPSSEKKFAFELRCRVGGSGFAFGCAPRFRHLAINAVNAIARTLETDNPLATSTGLQGQILQLRNKSVEPKSVKLSIRGPGENAKTQFWIEVDDFSESKPDDFHFTVDAANGQIRFGDGAYGKVPDAGYRISATYLAGGGAQSNVSARKIKYDFPGVSGINPFPAAGGSDAEPVTRLRQRAAARLRSRDRAVTAADFEDIALRVGKMGRAKAIAGLHPDFPDLSGRMPGVVTVFIASQPHQEGKLPPWPSDAEIDDVKNLLDSRRVVGCELFVQAARIVPVKLTIKMTASAGFSLDLVKREVSKTLNEWLNSDERGFGTNLTGGDLWSRVLQTTIAGAPVVGEIESLVASIGGKNISLVQSKDGLKILPFGTSPDDASPTLNVRLEKHEIPWGLPNHDIEVTGAAP